VKVPRNNNNLAMPLTPTTTADQQINNADSADGTTHDVHNNYIDAEQIAYEEVASVVSNKDNPDMLCLTFRVWFIGILLSAIQAFISQYFWYRTRSGYYLEWGLVILLSFLIGKLFAWGLPTKSWSIASRYQFSFNPGPFSFKEHILIYVMFGAPSYGVDITSPFSIQRVYYKTPVHYITGIVFCASLYLMIFGIAGKYLTTQKSY